MSSNRSVIILVIKQIGLPLRGRPILLITRMITGRIGLHSVLLPLLITADYLVITQPETVSKFVLKYYTLHNTRGLIIIHTYTTAVKNK